MSVLIKNGTIVNADQSFSADVLCADGKIQEIGSNISAPNGAEVIDLLGSLLCPVVSTLIPICNYRLWELLLVKIFILELLLDLLAEQR